MPIRSEDWEHVGKIPTPLAWTVLADRVGFVLTGSCGSVGFGLAARQSYCKSDAGAGPVRVKVLYSLKYRRVWILGEIQSFVFFRFIL